MGKCFLALLCDLASTPHNHVVQWGLAGTYGLLSVVHRLAKCHIMRSEIACHCMLTVWRRLRCCYATKAMKPSKFTACPGHGILIR